MTKIAVKRSLADSELVTPPSDRVQPKKFNMALSEQGAVSGGAQKTTHQCIKCGNEVTLDAKTTRRCANCSGHFHLECLHGNSASLAAQHTALYRCRLCRVSDPLGVDSLIRMHAILESCDDKLADFLAFAFQRSRLLELETKELRSKLASLENRQSAQPMELTTADEVVQQTAAVQPVKKRALLFGDASVKKIRGPLRAQLSGSYQLTVLNLQNKSGREMIEEAKLNIAKYPDSQTGIFFHPGPGDCLELQGEQLLSAISDFAGWLKAEGRGAPLTVYSVPVLHAECRSANEGLMALADSGVITYQALTRVQRSLVIKASTVYDDETAATVAKVTAKNVSSFLGLPPTKRTSMEEKPPNPTPRAT